MSDVRKNLMTSLLAMYYDEMGVVKMNLIIDDKNVINNYRTGQSGHNPGATASTKAPTAFPSFQSVVKFFIGRSGNFVWIQFISL